MITYFFFCFFLFFQQHMLSIAVQVRCMAQKKGPNIYVTILRSFHGTSKLPTHGIHWKRKILTEMPWAPCTDMLHLSAGDGRTKSSVLLEYMILCGSRTYHTSFSILNQFFARSASPR